MKQNLHIQSELLLNHIELTDEDLSELPPYPKVEEKKVQPRLIGIVCRCRSLDNYAFVVTNMYGINNTSTPYSPVQLYLEKSQWKDVTYLKEDMYLPTSIQCFDRYFHYVVYDSGLCNCSRYFFFGTENLYSDRI